jgi:lipopolysaccharide/colanic/teichoic acid biosynthesis glycosyltransferase
MSARSEFGMPKLVAKSQQADWCAHQNDVPLRYSANWSRPFQTDVKRFIDLLVSTSLLISLAPILLLIAVAVRTTSRGPVLYRWRVIGKNGYPFTGYKFRSMVVDADQIRSSLLDRNEMSGPVFKLKNDPRITLVGRWLRKFSLDELPQLWSVFKGDMSLVGPRPPLVDEYRLFTEKQKLKVSVKPGITCLWQVKGRNEIKDFDEWVRLDLEYIEKWSLALDLKILLLTIPAVLTGKGR